MSGFISGGYAGGRGVTVGVPCQVLVYLFGRVVVFGIVSGGGVRFVDLI